MTKVKIFTGPEETEKVIRLAVSEELDGVTVKIVDERGYPVDSPYIATFKVDKEGLLVIQTHSSVNAEYVNRDGLYIKVV